MCRRELARMAVFGSNWNNLYIVLLVSFSINHRSLEDPLIEHRPNHAIVDQVAFPDQTVLY